MRPERLALGRWGDNWTLLILAARLIQHNYARSPHSGDISWTRNCSRRSMGPGGSTTTMDELDIAGRLDHRRKEQQRVSLDESVVERLNRFIKLQIASFELLHSSPEGYRNFLRRNHKSRRVEVIDGVWHPVSADRRTREA